MTSSTKILTKTILAFIFVLQFQVGQPVNIHFHSEPEIEKPDSLVYKVIDTTKLVMEFNYPKNMIEGKEYPAIIFFFGGGWNGGSVDQFKPHAAFFAERGMIGIVADYRVRKRQGTTPFEAVKDAKSAIRYLREHASELQIDPNRIVASGGSAGGHLAAAAGIISGLEEDNEDLRVSSKPNALVLFNPVFDNGPDGYGYDRIGERYPEISPMHNITEGAPPTVVFLGTNDRLIPVATAENFKRKMEDAGNRCDLFLYEGEKHGFFNYKNPDNYRKTIQSAAQFLESIGILSYPQCGNKQDQTEKNTPQYLPNIVLIFADDMGYGDIQKYNPASQIPTPNLNTLAENGMRFDDAHANSAVCTPSRYGILTGRYAWRTRLQSGVLKEPDNNEPLITRDRLTLAGMLKKQNYHTACIGKWHLGIEWAKNENGESDYNLPFLSGPNEVGFDYFFGINAALDMTPYAFYKNNKPVQPLNDYQTAHTFPKFIREGAKSKDFNHIDALDELTEEAVSYIEAQVNNSNPFFLYFALTSPHKPVLPAKRFQGSTTMGPYADFIVQTDWTVGQILSALKENDLEDNTLVIFTSDNGSFMFRVNADKDYPFGQEIPSQSFYARKVGSGLQDHSENAAVHGYYPYVHTANSNWRGTKADIWEGGHRVPFIVRWPGHVQAGTKSVQTICITDVMATLADITGYSLNENEGEDSFSILPVLLNEETEDLRAPVIHHSGNGTFAIRNAKWKMVFSDGSGGREVPIGKPFEEPYSLFNLEFDPSETTNVIDEYPAVAKKLTEEMDKIRHSQSSK